MIKTIARNTLFLSASQIIARGIGFIYFIFLARVLGVATFGVYTFTLSFVYNFIPVADFGIERLVLRDISRRPGEADYYLARLFPLRIFLGFGSYVLILIVGLILGLPVRQIGYFAVFGLALIPFNLTMLLASFQNAREKMQYLALANISIIVLTSFFGVFFALWHLPLLVILSSYLLANLLVGLSFLAYSFRRGFKMPLVLDLKFCREALAESWPFASMMILAVFYLRLSVVIIGLLKGPEATGLYGSAFKFIEAGILVPQSVALALFPAVSRLFMENKKRLKKIYLKGIAILLLFSLPFSLILVLFPKNIIEIAYGINYLASEPVYKILGAGIILFFVNALAGNIIQCSPKVKQFLPLSLLNFLVAFVLCLVLIPKYSIIGAAWAVVGGEVTGLMINNYFVFKLLRNEN